MIALRGTNELVLFHSATPGTIQRRLTVVGLDDDTLRHRPSAGERCSSTASRSVSRLHLSALSHRHDHRRRDPRWAVVRRRRCRAPFGVDFNPLSDRLRILTSTQQNCTVDPDTGVATRDTPPLAPPVHGAGAAFDNNVDGTRVHDAVRASTRSSTARPRRTSPATALSSPSGLSASTRPSHVRLRHLAARRHRVRGAQGRRRLRPVHHQPADRRGAADRTDRHRHRVNGLVAMPVTYQFAEGSTGAFFDTDILLANPTTQPVPVTVTYHDRGWPRW